jgi:transposase
MVRPDFAKWGQTLADLRKLAIQAKHERTRERFQALYMIGSEQSNATAWAKETNRSDETVLRWIHGYNERGAEAIDYRRTGGRPPFLTKRR